MYYASNDSDGDSSSWSWPCCLTSLLYKPNRRKGAAHWPTNKAVWFFPIIFSEAEVAMEASDAHRNQSDGIFDVCDSMAFATDPSVWSCLIIFPITKHLFD